LETPRILDVVRRAGSLRSARRRGGTAAACHAGAGVKCGARE
jgi:hypothetical protein